MKHGEAISQPVYNVNGVIEQRVGTVMDVTERHNAEADLRASEALARGQMQALTRTLDAIAQESVPDRFMDHVLSTIMEQLDAYIVAVWQKDGEDGLAGFECSCDNNVLQSQSGRSTLHIMSRQNNFVWQQMSHTPRIIIFEDLTQVQETRVPMRHYLINQGVVTASRSTAFDDVVQSQKVSVPILKYLTAQGIVTLLLVPLLLAGELMGWMGVRFKQKRSFREEELQLVLALANQATLASQVIRLSEQARQAAIESERNRLARDMHDTLAQGFTGVIVQLEAAEDAIVQGLTHAADQHSRRQVKWHATA
jgi:nitrate/nitrite-specific signal transduction histidine kinase